MLFFSSYTKKEEEPKRVESNFLVSPPLPRTLVYQIEKEGTNSKFPKLFSYQKEREREKRFLPLPQKLQRKYVTTFYSIMPARIEKKTLKVG